MKKNSKNFHKKIEIVDFAVHCLLIECINVFFFFLVIRSHDSEWGITVIYRIYILYWKEQKIEDFPEYLNIFIRVSFPVRDTSFA